MATSCVIADDHPAILKAISAYLLDEGINVLGTARRGLETIEIVERRRPQVVLLDVELPDLSGLEVARRIIASGGPTAVVLYSGGVSDGLVQEAFDLGVRGIILKEAPLHDLTRALGIVADGGVYLDGILSGRRTQTAAATPQLTPREREVLRLASEGMSNAEIGAQLFVAPDTVRAHLQRATTRLGARNRAQAIACAMRLGVIA